MTCAKAYVRCTLVLEDGSRIIGTNYCKNPQPVCPRAPGEGYEKCKTICDQQGHAETVALANAGDRAIGSHAYVEFHTYACRHCQESLFAAGVKALTIGPPPAEQFYDPNCISRLDPWIVEKAEDVALYMSVNNIRCLGPVKLR